MIVSTEKLGGSHTSYIWSCAAVGAASHPHDNGIVAKAMLLADFLDLVNEYW